MTMLPKLSLRERTRGRWHGILTALGVHPRYLVNKHGPCPICNGGRDRFRYDNRDGNGSWICARCGAGSGVDLVMRVFGLPFREAATRIEQVLGEARPEPRPRPKRSNAQNLAALKAMWLDSSPVRRDDPVDRFLRARAIDIELYPAVLRTALRLLYPEPASYHPGMLALVAGPNGKPATLHKTYLTHDGRKAAVEEPRRFASGSIARGAAVRLAAYNGTLGIAEGIETAFAAMRLFGIPCWAALNASLLENFQPPPDVNHLIIYGDNDAHQRGQRASWTLAARLKIKVDIKIPDQTDTDWNDVLTSGGVP
jgi:putative DNA primase/helicase